DKVAVGETILVVESMGVKMPVNSTVSGVIVEVWPSRGDQIAAGDAITRVSTIVHGSKDTVSHVRESQLREMGGKTALVSPSAGIVLRIYKTPGETIHTGESLLVLEAMKMETPISSSIEGVIAGIAVNEGEQVKAGQILATVEMRV
ncbi:MAG: biotin/lipoyl-binding protein, partial [Spirochaetaceae bacterium]|nr:biotin/lipoyl-binding protein [Spirochaetaceae bacterium]